MKLKFTLYLLLTLTSHYSYADIIKFSKIGDIQSIKQLLSSGKTNLEKRAKNGDTALIIAARQDNIKLFNVLIDAGADINVRDHNQRDILNIAIRNKNTKLARQALARGIDATALTSRYRGSALIFASAQGQVEIVDMIIRAGAPLNRVNILGWTALLEAVILGDGSEPYVQIVKLLVEAGADTTISDNAENTPLDHARNQGYDDIVRLLQ